MVNKKIQKDKKSSISYRITSYTVKMLTIFAVILSVILGVITCGMLLQENRELHASKTERLAQKISAWYQTEVNTVIVMAETVEHYKMLDDSSYDIASYFAESMNQNPVVYDYYIADTNRHIFRKRMDSR